jgi:hypothetical protein
MREDFENPLEVNAVGFPDVHKLEQISDLTHLYAIKNGVYAEI